MTGRLGSPQAERESHRARFAAHHERVAGAHGDRAHADEHLVVGRHGRLDVDELEHLGTAVAALRDRPHAAAACERSSSAGDTARHAAGLVARVDAPVRLGDLVERMTRSMTGTIAPDSTSSPMSGPGRRTFSATSCSPVNRMRARSPRRRESSGFEASAA